LFFFYEYKAINSKKLKISFLKKSSPQQKNDLNQWEIDLIFFGNQPIFFFGWAWAWGTNSGLFFKGKSKSAFCCPSQVLDRSID
jgi:hypothetical protein